MARPKERTGDYERIALDIRRDLLLWLDGKNESRRAIIESLLERSKDEEEMEQAEYQKSITQTLETFIQSPEFKSGCISATKASWGGSGYSVELLPDGTSRVLWDNQIGNLYESEGEILRLPKITDDEYQELVNDEGMDEEEFFDLGFSNESDELARDLRNSLKDTLALHS